MSVKTLTIDGRLITAPEDQTILEASLEIGVKIPIVELPRALEAHGETVHAGMAPLIG